MPRTFNMDSNHYYLKMNSDPFLDSVMIDVVDGTGQRIQNLLTISPFCMRVSQPSKEVAGKLGMYADMQVTLDGKKMILEAEAVKAPIQIITNEAEAA